MGMKEFNCKSTVQKAECLNCLGTISKGSYRIHYRKKAGDKLADIRWCHATVACINPLPMVTRRIDIRILEKWYWEHDGEAREVIAELLRGIDRPA